MLVLKIERVLGGLEQSQMGGWVVPSSAGMSPHRAIQFPHFQGLLLPPVAFPTWALSGFLTPEQAM